MDQLRTQLSGISLTGQLEPSHLLDMTVQQWEKSWPEKCHSREEEVQNLKLTTSLSLEGAKLKVTVLWH